jgi:TBC1 domain family member 8/9
VPLNPAFDAAQVISALTHLEASHLVIGTETNLPFKPPKSNITLLETLVPDLTVSKLQSETTPSLRQIVLVDNSYGRIDPKSLRATIPFTDISSDKNLRPPVPDEALSGREIVNIQFTSGTTSMPKAACLSHRSILNNGHQIGARMLLTPKDIVCCPPPLFHCFGCILGYMATATHGASIVFPAEAYDPKATLTAVQEEKATALYGVPTMFLAELELLDNGTVPYEGFQYLRTGIAAGSSVPAELMRRLHKTLNLTELTICYGMTETSPVSAMTTIDDPIEKRINTVGRLLPHVEAKVVDPFDHSKILEVGQRGELAVHGYLVMKEYWGQPEKTAEAMKPDETGKVWMHTGDEAIIDEDGYVAITGRIKDLIIRGGENIQPLEIENCLFAHPKVSEVSVVGVPDERYGEVVAAFVIPRRKAGEQRITIEEVRSWAREKLSHYLAPKYVFFVDSYPKTASGKIQKFKLRETGVKLMKEQGKDVGGGQTHTHSA